MLDILVAIQYLASEENAGWARWIFLSMGVSVLWQIVVAVFVRQGWLDILAACVDAKHMVETWRVVTGAPKPPGQLFSNETTLTIIRLAEVLFEMVPQSILQAFIIMRTQHPTTLQWISLTGSCFASGFILANASIEMDQSFHYRRTEPTCHGMYPHGSMLRSAAMFAGETMFVCGFQACRVAAIASLLATPVLHGWAPRVGWLALEFALYNALKWADRTWYFWVRNRDSVLASTVVNFFQWIMLSHAPFTWWRHPFNACPPVEILQNTFSD